MEAEAKLDQPALARGQCRKRVLDVLASERDRGHVEGRLGQLILDEVGRTFGVTRERIRQIENTTLKTLASLPEAQRLRDSF